MYAGYPGLGSHKPDISRRFKPDKWAFSPKEFHGLTPLSGKSKLVVAPAGLPCRLSFR